MTTLRVLIADDELLARKRLRRLLGDLPEVEIVGECKDGVQVLRRVARGGVDVILLDIHMPHLDGMEVVALKSEGLPVVVFTTAFAQHAVRAFELEAADYLLKPLEAQRLERAMERARRRVTALSADDGQVPTDAPRAPFPRLPVETRRGVVLLDPDHITHAVIDGVSCLLHTDDQHYVTDFRLSDLERRLPADRFMRLHRQALVNLLRVERLEPTESGGYRAILDTGATVAVSRGAARRLRQWWEAR